MIEYKYDVTVEVCTYNSSFQKLLYTLQSILTQKDISFQIVISDDGSFNNYDEKLKVFFSNRGYSDYILNTSKYNRGTVLNCLSTLSHATGKYIKGISPGDMLYDSYVLSRLYNQAEEEKAEIIFAVADCYSLKNGVHLTEDRILPRRLDVYMQSQYDQQVEYFLSNDVPLGAAYFIRTDTALKYRSIIAGRIKYAEDYSVGLMLADGIKLHFFPMHMIWYESDSGISARTADKWIKALKEDLDELHNILLERIDTAIYPKFIKRQDLLYRISDNLNNKIMRYIIKTIIFPLYPYYIYRGHKITTTQSKGDINKLEKLIRDVNNYLKYDKQ